MTLEQETRDAVAELGQSIMDIVNDDKSLRRSADSDNTSGLTHRGTECAPWP
jgi:hypothetical protein